MCKGKLCWVHVPEVLQGRCVVAACCWHVSLWRLWFRAYLLLSAAAAVGPVVQTDQAGLWWLRLGGVRLVGAVGHILRLHNSKG